MESNAPIGDVLGGTYRITRLIGRGGMGAVYEAEHLRLPRRFAVKFLRPDPQRGADSFVRFRREAEIASSLRHDHIAEVIDFNDQGETPYIVMDLLHGEELAARASRVGQFDVATAWSILDQAASALEAAHERHVVHRDLKPQNIFLCRTRERDDLVKVMDFGVSKILDTQSVATQAGLLLGTPSYMAPEQADGRGAVVDARADVFALGTIAYELLAGRRAFEAAHSSATIYRVCNFEPDPLSSLRADVPDAVAAVIRKAMAKRPDDRFASMAAMRDALRAACGQPAATRVPVDTNPEARPPSPWLPTTMGGTAAETEARRTRKHRTWVAGATMAALGLGWAATGLRPERPVPPAVQAVATVATAAPASLAPPGALPVVDWRAHAAPVVAQNVAQSQFVTLSLGSIPAGATVIHEGRRVGRTPLRMQLPRSDKPTKVQIRRPSFLPHTATVVPNKNVSLNVPLLRVPAQ